jgi:hypothetical protein
MKVCQATHGRYCETVTVSSVADPRNFGMDPDLDPRIHTLTNGSGYGSCYFRQRPSRRPKKSFFAYYFLKVHLYHFSKIKSHKEVT